MAEVAGCTSCHALRKALPAYPSHLPVVVYSSANLTSDIMKGLIEFFTEGEIGALEQHREALCSALRAVDQPGLPAGTSGCGGMLCMWPLCHSSTHFAHESCRLPFPCFSQC